MLWYAVLRGEVRAGRGYIGISSDLLIVPRRHVRCNIREISVLRVLPLWHVLGWGGRHVFVDLLWHALLRGEVRAEWGYIGIGSDLLIVPRWHVRCNIRGGLHGSRSVL